MAAIQIAKVVLGKKGCRTWFPRVNADRAKNRFKVYYTEEIILSNRINSLTMNCTSIVRTDLNRIGKEVEPYI